MTIISKPIIQEIIGGYRFIWSEGNEEVLVVTVARVKVVGDAIWAEISLEHEFEEHPKLRRIRINLLSQTGRSSLTKRILELKLHLVINWADLIEQICNEVIERARQGESLTQIASTDEVKPLEYLIYPIAPLNKPTVIFGDPGSGKSQLAVVLNIILALPWHDNPLKLVAPEKPIKALFLDYEADPDDIRRQLISLVNGMGLGYVSFYYRRCSMPIADDLDSIRNHAEEIGAQCLFIDSISLAAGDDLNKMAVATAYFRALRQLKMTTISLAHTSKDRENKSKTIIGSVLWEAGARNVIECRGQEDDDTLDIALFHRKANLSKKFKPLGYRITYDNDLPSIVTWHDPKNVAEFVERMNTNQRVLIFLKEGPAANKEIEDSLGITPVNCRVTTSRLKKKNLIVKVDEKWGLVTRF